MTNKSLIDCGNGFWNLRALFKIKGVINIGTQASLVAVGDGTFIWLDCAPLAGEAEREVMRLTDNGENVVAVLNLHPFHTMFAADFHRRFPAAEFFGSARHKEKCPEIKWEPDLVESDAVTRRFSGLLDFSLPRGVDYISADEAVHFSSLLAYHPASGTVHSDDTLNVLPTRFPFSLFPTLAGVNFHMTLAKALQKRPGAASDFRTWAHELGRRWSEAARICAAHNGTLDFAHHDFVDHVEAALKRAEPVLARHEAEFG